MAPKLKGMWIVAIEQGGTAEAVLDVINGMINGIIKNTVFFLLRTCILLEMAEED
jgi:hypothetical protein